MRLSVVALVLAAGCGDAGTPMMDGGFDAGADAGPPLVRVDFRYRYDTDGGCSATCSQRVTLDQRVAAGLVGVFYNPDAGRRCGISNQIDTASLLAIDCTVACPAASCCVPPGASATACGWAPP